MTLAASGLPDVGADPARDIEPWRARLDAYTAAAFAAETDGSHDISHVRRVWRNCRIIAADAVGADGLTLVAAAHLHDLVNVPKNAPDRCLASKRSAEAAAAYLAATDFPRARIDAVAHAIEAHSFSAGVPPETLEARILQDADRIDSLGALGVARTFYVAGMMGSRLFDEADPWGAARTLDDKRFALDHFEIKLFRLVDTMQTDAGRRLAEARTQVMGAFVDGLRAEIG